ncbi:LysR family transcriptional regulator [Ureibacillus sinduriensis]|uniref:Transcriptional regulator n=1 Tax=Ureibacillus sinduriensis BLB-1 = JCM 15800 TaxID=1384057 RepID=A0A0A3ING5_9BACL|nr:LysR family transcriptional regulator [Ureibacillus sinduriensis]KGR76377.1 transcriptional regulator [Ureibacillus sinduriensis BLB-1 = JCM 15800]
MNLHALRLFHIVAEKGNVTRAAEELNISQPAVTAQIKKLEQEIGIILLAPRGRGILLTEAGIQLAKHTKRLFSLEAEIESYIEQYKNGSIGKLRIVATYLPANFLLPKWLARYKQRYPDVEVELTTTNSLKAIDQLINYQAEIAFIGGRRESHPLINRRELFEDEMWFVVHKNHKFASNKVTLAQIVREPFVFREEGSSVREKLVSLCKINNVNQPTVGLQINGLNETIRAVMEGYGVTFVSSLEVKEYIACGDVAKVNVDGIELKNPISICTRKGDGLSMPAHHVIQMVINEVNN